jgi:hypothetical protein
MTTVPALTTLRLGYKDPLTDTFGAHPLLGAVLDLNDGRTFTLAAPDGFTLSAPRRTLVPVGNIRTQGEAVSRGVYQHNRTARVKVTLGPLASYANLTGALRTLLQWLDAPPGIPFMLQYQAPNASAPSYLDVVGCAHTLPLDEEQWLRLQLEPMEITFLVRPGLKGDRVTLQNLAPNPGFEQGSGPAVLAFSDNFANINAYAVQAGSAPTVASSIMTLAVGARVAFGSPGWSHLNLWQLRFKWVTGLTARFYLHYTDANNHLKAEPTGTSWALIPTVAGVATTIATGAVTLTNGNFYWIKVTQFPWPTPSATVAPPYLTASLFNDSAGAVGTLVTNGALADAFLARAGYARGDNRVRYLREAIVTLRDVLVSTESGGPTYDRGRLHVDLAEALEAVATAESNPQALAEAVSEYQQGADDLRVDVFALEKAEALASAGRGLVRLREREPGAAGKAVLLTRAIDTFEASLKAQGSRGKLLDRDTTRLDLATLYLERATNVPGPSGTSGCNDLASGRGHLMTILGHVGNEVAPIQRKAKQVLRKIDAQARSFGCA